MEDKNIAHIWRQDEAPAGASVWPYLTGKLQSCGNSHYHSLPDYFCPHIISSGRGVVRTGDYTVEVGPGDMFTLWPGVEVEYYDNKESPWQFYYFHIEGPGTLQFVESCGFSKEMIVFSPEKPGEAENVFAAMYDMADRQHADDKFKILSQLYMLPYYCATHEVDDVPDRNKEILYKAQALLEAQLASGVNVNELCIQTGVSRITMFRIFQKELGVTPIEYISEKRISKAKELLQNSQAILKTVAKLSGFQSEKYFIRRFKQATGLTPGEFRKISYSSNRST